MLRIALLILLLANAGYFAWSQGALSGLGWAPVQHREPERLQQQLQPEALQLLIPPPAPASTPAPVPTATAAAEPAMPAPAPQVPDGPPQCLQAGIYDDDASDTLRRALLLQLPEGGWSLVPITQSGRWMVYIGKFADSQALEKARAELVARRLDHDRAGGALEPGLSLGRFSSEEAATRQLTQLVRQGVRAARVVQERPDRHGFVLRLPAATPALRAQVQALPAFGGKALQACNS